MTKTEIINVALSRLGESPIQSPEDGSAAANAANIVYDIARRAALRDYPWSFAVREADLPRLEQGGYFYEYAYELPSDCIRVVELLGNPEYETSGRSLLTNAADIKLRYVADVSDTGLFDSKFTEALTYKLASELALSIKGSPELMASYNNAYLSLAKDGGAKSAQESRKELSDNPYVDARYI
jgi:hypothetical protein